MNRSFHDISRRAATLLSKVWGDGNGTDTGTVVDVSDADGVVLTLNVGAWTDGTHIFKLYEQTTEGGSYTLVPYAKLDPANAASAAILTDSSGAFITVDSGDDDNAVFVYGYTGRALNLRLDVVTTGSPSTGVVAGAVIESFNLRNAGQTPSASRWASPVLS